MHESDTLHTLLRARRRAGADTHAIDREILQRFGTRLAVMFTDLVGFSRLVETFGILHFLQLIQESEDVFTPLIENHQGRCLKHEGDSLLAVFTAPADALRCAQAMVASTRQLNVGRPPENRIEVCIGLGYGDVLQVDGNEVWGAQVNAASKLGEERAQGGEILVTQAFQEALSHESFMLHGTLFGDQSVFRWVN